MPSVTLEIRFTRADGTRVSSLLYPPLKWRATIKGPSGTAVVRDFRFSSLPKMSQNGPPCQAMPSSSPVELDMSVGR